MSFLALGIAALAASSQSPTPTQGPRPEPPAGVLEAQAPPAGAGEPAVVPPRVAVSLDAPPIASASLADVAPAPEPARFVAGEGGDRLIAPAAGDPHFLGFAAGRHHPPAGERVDPELLASIQASPSDGRPEPVVYAFAMFQRRITAERTAELERLGARVLGYHPSNCLKLAIPLAAFEAVAAYPELRWVGAPRRWQKMHPALARHAALAAGASVRAIVDVYESDLGPDSTVETVGSAVHSDGGVLVPAPLGAAGMTRTRSNGWQERALADLGCQVDEYVDATRSFHVRVPAARVDALAAADFVQFVEPDVEKGAFHDDSTPMIYSDSGRAVYSGGTTLSVVAGIIDTGFDAAHSDLNHAWAVGWEYGGTGGPWSDPCEHGSHVAGTLLGNGASEAGMRGNAPGLGWGGAGRFYVVKTSNQCKGWSGSLASWLSPFHTPYFDGASTSPTPLVINNSWGAGVFNSMGGYIGPYFGTESDARLLDDEVYSRGQMHVFAAGNDGSGASTIGLQPAAKNVFTVGSVDDGWSWGLTLPGGLSGFSSRGPTGDGRWKPNVVAPGDSIESVDAGSGDEYAPKAGTSMATPHVTGVAAQLLDHYSFLRNAPERAQSLLMATAMTKGNQQLTYPTEAHLDEYGAGKVEAWKAGFGSSQMGWSNWGAWLPANSYTWADFTVSPGCTRLVVCMTYSDPQCSSGASQALVNNLDLALDQPPIDPNFNTGDWVAQQSALDNTEIRILDFPIAGTWRWKIWPTQAPQGSYYGLTVWAQYGDITPDLSIGVLPEKTYVKPYEYIDVAVTVSSPTYLASNVVVEGQCWSGSGLSESSSKYLNDGALVTETLYTSSPRELLGDILHGSWRWCSFSTQWGAEGVWDFTAYARGDNVAMVTGTGSVVVDGTPPSTPANLTSTGTPYVWTNQPQIGHTWDASTDNLSGVAGYSISISQDAPVDPDTTVDTTGLSSSLFFPSNAYPQYFNVRAVDRSANGSTSNTYGPFYVDTDWPTAMSGLGADVAVGGTTCGAITLVWDAGADYTSGLAGYSVMIDNDPQTTPSGSIDALGESYTTTLAPSPDAYYAHVSAVDLAGNVGLEQNYGPFYVGDATFTSVCDAKPHSGGCTAAIGAYGCPSYAASDLHVSASNVLGGTSGRLLWSLGLGPQSGGGAFQAMSASTLGAQVCLFRPRIAATALSGGTPGACDGAFDATLDAGFLAANGLFPGTTVYVQYVFDDPGTGQTAQTDALSFVVQP